MIFYDCPTAPSPRRARMFIAEKGLEIETRMVDLGAGEQLSPGFLAVNPRATVPVLVADDGTTLTENLAIAAYLEELHPTPRLMGGTPEEKALVLMWNGIAEHSGGMAIAEVLRNSAPGLAQRALTGPVNFAQIQQLVERGKVRVALFHDMLEQQLAGRDYLAIDGFSLDDITAFVFIEFAARVKMPIPEANQASLAWHARIAARPSAAL